MTAFYLIRATYIASKKICRVISILALETNSLNVNSRKSKICSTYSTLMVMVLLHRNDSNKYGNGDEGWTLFVPN